MAVGTRRSLERATHLFAEALAARLARAEADMMYAEAIRRATVFWRHFRERSVYWRDQQRRKRSR